MKATALALAAAMIAGVASAQQAGTPAADPNAQTFTGWVKVANGELQLYRTQQLADQPFARPCTSVVLPRDLQRVSADLSGTQVTFSGRAVDWTDRGDAPVMTFKGSRVANDCGGDTVIQADTFRVLRAG
jgi:hypothetical protein